MKDKNFNYWVILFKNKERKKIIKRFVTLERATKFYDTKIKFSENILFDKKVQNGFECKEEIALVQVGKNLGISEMYRKDNLGRQIKIEVDNPDFKILKISEFKTEEYIFDYQLKKKTTFNDIIKRYLNASGLKMLSKLNNKVIIQNDDNYSIITLKNSEDCERFLEVISDHFYNEKRSDCIVIFDTSISQRKYLYEILVEKGFPKSYLFRQRTTHPTKK